MHKFFSCLAISLCLGLATASGCVQAAPREFAVTGVMPGAKLPAIVLPYSQADNTGFDWEKISKGNYAWYTRTPEVQMVFIVHDLRQAIKAMTNQELPVVSGGDLAQGIVLTLLKDAPAAVRNDPQVQQALRNTGEDSYNANEAFFVRSEPGRVLLVANTLDGLNHAVVELLESVGYEALGMGPNWTHVPDYRNKPLVFNLERAGQPGYYIRSLWATSGQQRGVGTLVQVNDPADVPVGDSYRRWQAGTRMQGQSMPSFPGHAMQGFHDAVLKKMREMNSTEGLLVEKTVLGLDAARPAAAEENKDWLWINTDAQGSPAANQTFLSDGKEWKQNRAGYVSANLDLSSTLVRGVILDALKSRAQTHFEKEPDELLVFGTDPEDGGGYAALGKLLSTPSWYPDYLKSEGVPFGRPYVLNGFKGLNQPRELWDPQAASDIVFGFNNWLLREYDKWIDSLPASERVTATGKEKKQQVRCSFYSYNYHDVPPNFNLDPRIRVMIASYPKHRGWDKWKNFKTQTDMAEAFQVMLPREPSGDYWIISLSYFRDPGMDGIGGSRLPVTIAERIHDNYRAGFRALSVETDFNFGKQGLEYYLYAKMLWNPKTTVAELDALRDRWLQRAYGEGWREMKAYYDFIAPENYAINAPNNWAKAIRFIDAADAKIDDASAAQKRLDDLKQYWYFYYLVDSGKNKASDAAFKEFVWKGQMSYMTAMHMVARRFFNTNNAKDAAGAGFNSGPARYSHAETQAWWAQILDRWKVTPVASFADAQLADGKPARTADVNDMVRVSQFGQAPADVPFYYNAGSSRNEITFLTVARQPDDEIGFHLFWPSKPESNHYRARDVFYGIARWDAQRKEWDELVDKTMVSVPSRLAADKDGKEYQQALLRYKAPQAGTYRIEVVNGGDASRLTTPDYNLSTGQYSGSRGHTYLGSLTGHTQSPVYFYIPKGTKSIDLEIWDSHGGKRLQLHRGLPATGMAKTRVVDVSERGTHVVKLEPGEDGSLAALSSNGFAFPYLYSVPMQWAKTPAALMVPRAIAQADGLTIE